MNELIEFLRRHPFRTGGVSVEFNIMTSPSMLHPYPDPAHPNVVMAAGSRRLSEELTVEVVNEIQRDLDLVNQKHPEIKRYGVWYYELLPGMIRYAKAVAK